MIAKRLLGEDRSSQFSAEMLQIISDVREPLEDRLNAEVDGGGPSQTQNAATLSLKEIKHMFQEKLDQKKD